MPRKKTTPTVQAVEQKSNKSLQSVELRRKSLANYYKNEELVSVRIPPLYKPFFGESMSISINGILVIIPCDGKAYKVGKTYACEAKARMQKQDMIAEKCKKMGDIENNFERNSGDIKFI